MNYREIQKCRICGNSDLVPILNLGNQFLTGVFPRSREQKITYGPLELVKCQGSNSCGLIQLRHSYEHHELYGENYGYRSGLNQSMVNHLHNIVEKIMKLVSISSGDLVIDIGSNDSTLLQTYPQKGPILVGIDPTGEKFKEYYPVDIHLIPEFFSAKIVKNNFGEKKAKIVTSIAMFYDLDDPLDFMRQVHDILADDGIWVFEQSYMPSMLEKTAYDTICHEHLEYYRLKQIKWMAERAGFKIIDLELNNVNGGSFCVTAAKKSSSFRKSSSLIEKLLEEEENKGLSSLKPYAEFKQRVYKHREDLLQFIQKIKAENKKSKAK